MKVLGIDPGLACTGFGIIEVSNNDLSAIDFGVVKTNGTKLTSFEEKPTISHLVNAGIYILEQKIIDTFAHHTWVINKLHPDLYRTLRPMHASTRCAQIKRKRRRPCRIR